MFFNDNNRCHQATILPVTDGLLDRVCLLRRGIFRDDG